MNYSSSTDKEHLFQSEQYLASAFHAFEEDRFLLFGETITSAVEMLLMFSLLEDPDSGITKNGQFYGYGHSIKGMVKDVKTFLTEKELKAMKKCVQPLPTFEKKTTTTKQKKLDEGFNGYKYPPLPNIGKDDAIFIYLNGVPTLLAVLERHHTPANISVIQRLRKTIERLKKETMPVRKTRPTTITDS